MTDKEKLDAIRAEIHRLIDVRGYDREMANDLFAFMDSLPNETVRKDIRMKKNYPPKGEFYMYPQYDEEDNLVGFTTDYEGKGAFGIYCKIITNGEIL